MSRYVYATSMNYTRKLTNIRRSLHSCFKSRAILTKEMTGVSSVIILNLLQNTLASIDKNIAILRQDESLAMSREFYFSGAVLTQEAYPVKSVKKHQTA